MTDARRDLELSDRLPRGDGIVPRFESRVSGGVTNRGGAKRCHDAAKVLPRRNDGSRRNGEDEVVDDRWGLKVEKSRRGGCSRNGRR